MLRFKTDPRVPFNNNNAEREVRMPKVKLKIAGTFRTRDGARYFCILRSYFSTLKKQRQHLLDCLEEALRGNDPTDAFALWTHLSGVLNSYVHGLVFIPYKPFQ